MAHLARRRPGGRSGGRERERERERERQRSTHRIRVKDKAGLVGEAGVEGVGEEEEDDQGQPLQPRGRSGLWMVRREADQGEEEDES